VQLSAFKASDYLRCHGKIEMSTLQYLTIVVAALAAASFLSNYDENSTFVDSSYAGIMPAAISALPMPLPKSCGG
jgi:hypothetical protein